MHGFEPPGWRALAEVLRPQTRDPDEHESGIVSVGSMRPQFGSSGRPGAFS